MMEPGELSRAMRHETIRVSKKCAGLCNGDRVICECVRNRKKA